jgi:hypothetical protein
MPGAVKTISSVAAEVIPQAVSHVVEQLQGQVALNHLCGRPVQDQVQGRRRP